MDLKGAEIRNIIDLCKDIGGKGEVPLCINIPYYQRPYKWTEEQVSNLISDFYKNKAENQAEDKTDDEAAKYFVGSVVLVKNARGTDRHDVIDGQQRLTTVFLMNYLRFLLLRSYIQELLSVGRIIRESVLTDFAQSYGQLFGHKHTNAIERVNETILDEMETITDKDKELWESVYGHLLQQYETVVSLPVKDLSDMRKYYSQYIAKLSGFLAGDKLALCYSRETFNKNIKDALSRIVVIVSKDKNPEIHVDYDAKKETCLSSYIEAVKCQFNCVYNSVKKDAKDPLDMVKKMIDGISEMIYNINFCMIMTGNERDAYTLFEVLNDRAMKIEDLDLIKNLYYKEYCTKSNDNDDDIDTRIQELDEIWGDKVFSRDLPDAKIKLISYLGTIYLTADEDVFINKVEKYREILEKKYFDCHYNKQNAPYTYDKVLRDIRIYQMVKIIISTFDLPVNNAATEALKAECDMEKSITYKTFHLLNALKLQGVMPALVNLIIKKYFMYCESNEQEVTIEDFEKYVQNIAKDKNHENEDFRDIHVWSHKLWKIALYADGYKIPREVAKNIVARVYVDKYDLDSYEIKNVLLEEAQEQFKNWTSNWMYSKPIEDLKIKILLINLFRMEKVDQTLKTCSTTYSFKTERLHLDHLEANNYDKVNVEKYFMPNDPNEEREKYTNGLGNFMILDYENNNEKDNKPLLDGLEYYDNMRPGHWMIQEIRDMLNSDSYSQIKTGNYRVPTEAFFNERKSRLQKYFMTLLNAKLDEGELYLKD